MHLFKTIYRWSAVLSQIIKPTIYPKMRFCFGRLENTLLEFIVSILMHGIAYSTSFMPMEKDVSTIYPLFLCSFTHTNNLWHHNIEIRVIVCMFVLCIAYVCVSVCCSSDLLWHVKIATPTALPASAFRSGIFGSVAQLRWRIFLIRKIAPRIISSGTHLCLSPTRLFRHKCSGVWLLRGKISFAPGGN